ncbi:thioredoxin domain-containing protein [Pelagicoccus sp. SDUM812003]|uniref:thioredoxin domain-containing protein n=1 Tax=Pelagicoccus sp. SDUM812003 TaxID=3041267 RepID=UPI00280EC048|nr:thioredoxin domain-containing protein [Pelagicoccus sp. SDUM812003]MDQ8203381.1 thioredoxin domain-containing protein [Pelagicoccus sp. SDUM812003]
MDEGKQSLGNQLGRSRSPYLLQHADNPVHWMEWGEDAFRLAREREKPIFLSIGYSTCHWCHVMAHQSFENVEIAEALNQAFVNVKLDREERPDIDRIYMSYVQSTTGRGGWPMSVWLTPDLEPFYGGTYFPPEDRYGQVGFATLIQRISELWRSDRATLVDYGKKSRDILMQSGQADLSGEVAEANDAFQLCLSQLESDFDPEYGGFGGAPKFPMAPTLSMLLEGVARLENARLRELLCQTLGKMADGGIWDHLGGGFHRYSVDRYWHVPHYEKMLYDQGQLAEAYAEAYRLTGVESFAGVSREIVDYVARDLTGRHGQLLAAEDADSAKPDASGEHGEGAFYVWTKTEINSLLRDEAALFSAAYDIQVAGNAAAESDPHGELRGLNTLRRIPSKQIAVGDVERDEAKVEERLARSRAILFAARAKRPRPHLDDKVVVSWSALMISGGCRVYQATGYEGAYSVARDAANFIFQQLWDEETKTMYRVYREGRGDTMGFAEDYAGMAKACLDLYECDFNPDWIERSQVLLDALTVRFGDAERGGYFASQSGDRSVISRLKDDHDGAEPSASSLAALALLKLAAITDDESKREQARRTIEAFGEQWKGAPRAMPLMLVAATRFLEADQQIVIVGPNGATGPLAERANRHRKPFSALIAIDSSAAFPDVFRSNEKLKRMIASVEPGSVRAFVCEGFTCQEPVNTAESLDALLR